MEVGQFGTFNALQGQSRGSSGGLALVGLLFCLGFASCQSPHQATSYTEAQPPRRAIPIWIRAGPGPTGPSCKFATRK